jgi:cell division protein ZipA
MSALRWILLGLGVLVVAYVYWRGRHDLRRRPRTGSQRIEPTVGAEDALPPSARGRREPTLGEGAPEDAGVVQEAAPAWSDTAEVHATASRPRPGLKAASPPAMPTPKSVPAPGETAGRAHTRGTQPSGRSRAEPPLRKIVALRIVKRAGERIPGADLLAALSAEGLVFGDYKAFHRYAEGAATGASAPVFTVANMVEPGELDPERMADEDFAGVAVFMVMPGSANGPGAFSDMLTTAQHVAKALDAELLDQSGSTMTRQTADHLREEVIEFEHRCRGDQQVSATDR